MVDKVLNSILLFNPQNSINKRGYRNSQVELRFQHVLVYTIKKDIDGLFNIAEYTRYIQPFLCKNNIFFACHKLLRMDRTSLADFDEKTLFWPPPISLVWLPN